MKYIHFTRFLHLSTNARVVPLSWELIHMTDQDSEQRFFPGKRFFPICNKKNVFFVRRNNKAAWWTCCERDRATSTREQKHENRWMSENRTLQAKNTFMPFSFHQLRFYFESKMKEIKTFFYFECMKTTWNEKEETLKRREKTVWMPSMRDSYHWHAKANDAYNHDSFFLCWTWKQQQRERC